MEPTIYILQGESGLVFIATTDYEKIKEMKALIHFDGTHRRVSEWINGKCIFTHSI